MNVEEVVVEIIFYIHASVAVAAMACAMISSHAVHALLYAVVSFISLGISLYSLSAQLAAVLEVIVYAGAIMVLFVFAIMLLKMPTKHNAIKFKSLDIVGSVIVFGLFLTEIFFVIDGSFGTTNGRSNVDIRELATALFGSYGYLVEVISFVLLAGLVTSLFIGQIFIAERKQSTVGQHDSN